MRVVVDSVSKSYRRRQVLHEVSLRAEPGSVTVLMGPNGAGKSTLFKAMTSMIRSTGATTFGGRRWEELDLPRRVVGTYFGNMPFHARRTVREHLGLVRIACRAEANRVDEMMEQFHVGDVAATRVGDLSLGLRQRVGLASAMLGDPGVLLLDEPFSALDPHEADLVYDWLGSCSREGRTVIVSTHHLDRIEPFATHAAVLSDGRLRVHDAMRQRRSAPESALRDFYREHVR